MTDFVSVNTRAYARVFRFGRAPLDLSPDAKNPYGSIVSMTTQKGMAGAGAWMLAFKALEHGANAFEEISAGDWIVLWWAVNGVPAHGTIGRIENLRRGTMVSHDGAVVRTWNMSGKDFVDVFDKTVVWFDDYNNFDSNVGGRILGKRMNYVPGGTPNAIVENVVDAWLGSFQSPAGLLGGAFLLPDGLNLIEPYFAASLRMRVQDGRGRIEDFNVGDHAKPTQPRPEKEEAIAAARVNLRGEQFDESSLFQPKPGATLTQAIMGWSNPLLNELYLDVMPFGDPARPTAFIFHREKPFITTAGKASPWYGLDLHELKFEEVLNSDVGVTDAERINLLFLYAANVGGSAMDQYALYRPSYDEREVKRHGIRKLEEGTRFCGVGARTASAALGEVGTSLPGPEAVEANTWAREIAEWHGLLASWYGVNHLLLNGTMTLRRLFPKIRIGHRILVGAGIDRENYYVEGVNHSWTFPQGGTTTLSLTRGFIGPDEKFIALVNENASRFQRSAP